ncbi:hypothetical protein KDW55_02210 [Burkholderia sp. AU19243]|uniref:hypothetical protein n=1 Tax=Burkholderia sp. AU19243 TaxID=2824810 RepID=UPI001BA14077|nr:hypothetical protein [Burkholderia sp. AU19243]MBR8362131.1 hypothetical protein [Burkholderia sp. AU19243]
MKEPILSREEVQEIQRKCDITFFVPDDSETWPGTYINLQQLRDYTARIEAAILEKLCGEPVAFVCSSDDDFAPIVRSKSAAQKLSDEHGDGKIVPLYALNRSDL